MYGDVFRARDRQTGSIVALKRIKLQCGGEGGEGGEGAPSGHDLDEDAEGNGVPATALREVMALLEVAPHENVVALLDVVLDAGDSSGGGEERGRRGRRPPERALVFEFCERDLRRALADAQARSIQEESAAALAAARAAPPRQAAEGLRSSSSSSSSLASLSSSLAAPTPAASAAPAIPARRAGLDPATLRSYTHQLLRGLAALHSARLIHRDIKPPNILVDKAGVLKVADLGLSRGTQTPAAALTHEVVTLWYRAPEVLLGARTYSAAVDVWAAGA